MNTSCFKAKEQYCTSENPPTLTIENAFEPDLDGGRIGEVREFNCHDEFTAIPGPLSITCRAAYIEQGEWVNTGGIKCCNIPYYVFLQLLPLLILISRF